MNVPVSPLRGRGGEALAQDAAAAIAKLHSHRHACADLLSLIGQHLDRPGELLPGGDTYHSALRRSTDRIGSGRMAKMRAGRPRRSASTMPPFASTRLPANTS